MAEKWIRRKGTRASGFRYSGPDGKPVRNKELLGLVLAEISNVRSGK